MARALNRRDSLSADGRRELDGIVRRNGNDGVEFATETDSETFDAVVRPCRATGVLSVGGTGRLQAGRLYAVERPTRALVQSDDCVELPDDVDDNLDDVLARSDRDFDDDTVHNLKESISGLDGDAQDSAIELVEATDGEGVRLINDLSESDSDALAEFFALSFDTSDTDLPDSLGHEVRIGLSESYSRNHFTTNNWGGELYPNAEDETEVLANVIDNIEAVEANDDISGAHRLLTKDGGTGAYLVDLPEASGSFNPVAGAGGELEAATDAADDLPDGVVLRLSHEPDPDYSELGEDDIGDIAELAYGDSDATPLVNDALFNNGESKNPEFDATGGSIYVESKNIASVDNSDIRKIRQQGARFLGWRKANGHDLSNAQIDVYVRTEAGKQKLQERLNDEVYNIHTYNAE